MEMQESSSIKRFTSRIQSEDTSNLTSLLTVLSGQDQLLLAVAKEVEAMHSVAQDLYHHALSLKMQGSRGAVASVVLRSLFPGCTANWHLRLLEKPKKVYFKRRKFR